MVIVDSNSEFSKNYFNLFEKSLRLNSSPEEFYNNVLHLEGFTTTAFLKEISKKKFFNKKKNIFRNNFTKSV